MTNLRKLAEAETPGPWIADELSPFIVVPKSEYDAGRAFSADSVCTCKSEADRDYIAAANPKAILALLDASAAKDAEIARLREAFDPDRIHAQTIEAMTDAWNDICADTGCHPLDIERKGRELTFSPRHWADQTATWLIVKLCGETESDEATLKEPSHG